MVAGQCRPRRAAFVSRCAALEAGRSNPTVGQRAHIAEALGVGFDICFPVPEPLDIEAFAEVGPAFERTSRALSPRSSEAARLVGLAPRRQRQAQGPLVSRRGE